MTVKELFQWAKDNNVENAEIHILHRDGSGLYDGYDDINYIDIVNHKMAIEI